MAHLGPPSLFRILARLLLGGEHGRFVRSDLDEAFSRDLEKGIPLSRARGRYAWNVLGSVWSLTAARLGTLPTRGAFLDVKLGLRMLGKQPLLTVVAMLALGLGIPASLGFNHVLHAFDSPLPVPEGERVMGIRYWDRATARPALSPVHDYARWRSALRSFESMGATRTGLLNVQTGGPAATPVEGAWVSVSTFTVLRSTPLRGRLFDAADEVRGAPDVVILSEGLWTTRFAGDPGIVGSVVRISGAPHEVVGVMPESFGFPMGGDLWLPLRARPADYPVGEGPGLLVFGRLAAGVTADEASLEMEIVSAAALADEPDRLDMAVGEIVGMPALLTMEDEIDTAGPRLLLAQAVAFALLLIVCGNVGVLVLARTAMRTNELSIRTALGAGRRRILTQLFIEALVLAWVATGAGLIGAELFVRWLESTGAHSGIPYWMDLSLTPRTVLLALGVGSACAVVAGVVPGLRATRQAVRATLQGAATGSGLRFGMGSSLIIIAEVVLSVGFLALGGVTVRTAFQNTEGELGFEPERYVTAQVRVPWLDPATHPELATEEGLERRVADTQARVLERLATDERVVGVGLATQLPGHDGGRARVIPEAGPHQGSAAPVAIGTSRVGVDFFQGLGRPILQGRGFTSSDLEGETGASPSPVIVNTSFVEQVLGGLGPIGQRFRYPTSEPLSGDLGEEFEIVGVVGRFGANPLNPTRDAAIYHPLAPGEANPIRYLIQVRGDPAAYVSTVRELVTSVDPEATVSAQPLAALLTTETQVFRVIFLSQVALAAIAFLLSVTGLYALMSFTVSQRTREIGVRAALGAPPVRIVSTIGRRAAIQLAVGLGLGAIWGAFLLERLMDDAMTVPYDVGATVAVTVAVAGLVGILACLSPTLRCLRIQATEALRES